MLDLATVLRPSADRRTIVTGIVVSSTTSPPRAVVTIGGGGDRLTVPYVGTRPAAGAVVALARSDGRLWLIGAMGAQTSTPPPEPEPDEPTDTKPPASTTTTARLSPTSTGTARNGAVRPDTGDLYQGDWTGRGINTGQAVYRARQLAGACQSCTVRVKRLDAGVYAAVAPTFRLTAQSSLVGSPTFLDSHTGPQMRVGDTATVRLPADWGQRLIDGRAGGIAVHVNSASPYARLAGKAAGFMTVTLKIRS